MDVAGLALGVVGLGAQLFMASMECYNIFSDTENVGVDHDSLSWEIRTEQHRLMRWEDAWGIGKDTLDKNLDPNDYRYRYAVGTLARLVSVFANADILSTKYGISVCNAAIAGPGPAVAQVPGQNQGSSSAQKRRFHRLSGKLAFLTRRSKKGAPASRLVKILQNPAMLQDQNLVPGLQDEITRIKEATSELQQILPTYQKVRWAVVDKLKLKVLIEELRKYNDGLWNVLPGPEILQLQRSPSPTFSKINIPVQLPVQRNKRFVGRRALLQNIHDILRPVNGTGKQGRQVAVLHGLGGMGKSQIVTEYAYRYSASYTSVFWVDATSQVTLARSAVAMIEQLISHYQTKWEGSTPDFAQIGVMLGLPGLIKPTGQIRDGSSPELVVRAIKKWLSAVGNDNWLIIFDNHDDIESVNMHAFFPTCDFGSILVTTRRPEITHLGVGVEIGEIEKEAGISIVLSSASKDPQVSESSNDYIEASRIAEKLSYLPLALEQAGAYISAMRIPLENYIPLYNASFKRALSTNHPGLAESYRNETIFTTWKISFDSLPKPASELLLACAFIAIGNQDIPEQLFSRGKRKIPWLGEDGDFGHEALRPLFSFSFAKRKNDDKGFCFHPLVLEWSRESLDTTKRQKKARGAIILLAEGLRMAGTKTITDFGFERCLLAHVDVSLRNIREYVSLGDWSSIRDVDEEAADAMASIGIFLVNHRRDRDAEDIIHRSLLSTNPNIHTQVSLEATLHMGWIHFRKDCYEEALMYYERALAGQEQLFGKGHHLTLETIRSMAATLDSQERYEEALVLYEQVLATQEQALGGEFPYTIYTRISIACLFNNQGKHKEALKLFEQILICQEQVLGKEHPDVLRTVYNIAFTNYRLGRHSEALELYGRALTGQEKVLGKEHPDTLDTVHKMGLLFNSQGKHKEAESFFKRTLASQEQTLGDEHPDTLHTFQGLTITMERQGRYQEALELRERALAILEQVHGGKHTKTLRAVCDVAYNLQQLENFPEALKYFERALAGQEEVVGRAHTDTLRTIDGMAHINMCTGKHLEALELYKRVFVGQKETLGEEHPDTLKSTFSMGFVTQRLGRNLEAIELYSKALVGQQKVLGDNHLDTLRTTQALAIAMEHVGKYPEALELYSRALAGQEEMLGKDHLETLPSIYGMASINHHLGRPLEAIELYEKALAGQKKVLGEEHPDTLRTIYAIALITHQLGRHREAIELYEKALAGQQKVLGDSHPDTLLSFNRLEDTIQLLAGTTRD